MSLYIIQKGKTVILSAALLAAGICLIVLADSAREGAAEGLLLCSSVVIPSLFVFMCLCEWIATSKAARVLTGWFRPLFRCILGPAWQGGMAFLLCLLGGYPMGAAALVRLKEQGVLSRRQVTGLLYGVFGPSPAFVITGVGMGMLGSRQAGLLLWGACTLSSITTVGVLSRIFTRFREPVTGLVPMPTNDSQADVFVNAVAAATKNMLTICAMVIIFSTIGRLLSVLPLPAEAFLFISAVGEVTTGCAKGCAAHLSLPLLAAIISFGGVCTHAQIKAIAGDLMPRYDGYIAVRLLQAAFSFGFALLLCRWIPVVLPTLADGEVPVGHEFSPLPSVALLLTCVVFLSSLNIGCETRRKRCEKQGLYS